VVAAGRTSLSIQKYLIPSRNQNISPSYRQNSKPSMKPRAKRWPLEVVRKTFSIHRKTMCLPRFYVQPPVVNFFDAFSFSIRYSGSTFCSCPGGPVRVTAMPGFACKSWLTQRGQFGLVVRRRACPAVSGQRKRKLPYSPNHPGFCQSYSMIFFDCNPV
jgi:hypothetical protein